MNKKLCAVLIGSCFTTMAFADNTDLKTNEQKASYALGADLANNFRQQGVEIDIPALTAGMKDSFAGRDLQLSQQQMKDAVEAIKQKVMAKQAEQRKKLAEVNAQQGQAFLTENKNKEGVKVMPSGLQYKVILPGKGTAPTEDDKLVAHYRGTLIDGTEFDSSYNRGTPLEFKMTDVIQGWREALKQMKPGAKWEIFIPPALAYGSQGAGKVIGPNETLIFTLHLLKVNKTAKAKD